MTKGSDAFGLALFWLYLSIPMWVSGFASRDFFTGFFMGIIFVPFWGLLSVFVSSFFDRNGRK